MTTADAPLDALPVAGDDVDDRYTRLASATVGLRKRAGSIPLDRWFQLAGSVLMPLGAALILIGWYGTAHTTREWKQTPYLVSGGLLGLAIVFVGGFAYFAYWITRLVDEGRRQSAEAIEIAHRTATTLARIEGLLERNGGARVAGAAVLESDDALVTTASGTMVHRPSCPMVAGKANLRRVRPGTSGLKACGVCNPDVA